MKLLRALRADPILLALTVILVLAAWAPLAVTPFLPFSDLHNNAAAASMLSDVARGVGTLGFYYHVKWEPVPYWTGYAIMAAASAVGGVLFAAKAIVAVLAVALPLSTMRLLLALGRSPRLGLWAFAVFWEHNLYSGWVSYLLGMSFAIYTLALLVEMETWRDALRVLAWTLLVSVTHIMAVGLLAIAGVSIAVLGRLRGRSLLRYALALSGGAVPAMPWFFSHLFGIGQQVSHAPLHFDWDPIVTKAEKIFAYTFDHYPKVPDVWAPACVFALLLIGPALLGGVLRPRITERRQDIAAAIVQLTCFGLFAFLPMNIGGPVGHVHTYDRYASFALWSLLLLPRPRLRGRGALLLAPGVLCALWMDATTFAQLRRFGQNARPFLDIIHAVPQGSRVLPLLNKDTDPASAYDPYNQFHSYLTAATKSYDPYLFHHSANLLQYTPGREPRVPRWFAATDQLSMTEHAPAFDFILVQGVEKDPFRPGGRLAGSKVHVVAEGGIWKLYKIDK